jgi:hypothetical protein
MSSPGPSIQIFGAHDDATRKQLVRVAAHARRTALMAGGNAAMRTDARLQDLAGQILSLGRVTAKMMQDWVQRKGVILRGGGLDESPHVYRRMPDVLAAQGGQGLSLLSLSAARASGS